MDVRLLGPLELRVGGEAVAVRKGRARQLLALLALRVGERVSIDTLVDVLWGDEPPSNAVNAVQILVSSVRKSLAGAGEPDRIETLEGGYRLAVDRAAVDAHRLEAVVAAAEGIADPAQRLAQLDEALSAWRGAPLVELHDAPAVAGDIRRLEEARLAALQLRVDALLELGRHGEAVVELQRLVAEHPLRERFHAQLMTALYRAGRQADALAVYTAARTTLADELGLDPGPELQALAQAILEQSPALEAVGGVAVGGAVVGGAVVGGAAAAVAPRTVPGPLTPLIGRDDDVARLRELLATRRLITLTGPGGAGKTRLAAELLAGADGWWVDLSPALDRDAVVGAIVTATNTTTAPGDDDTAVVTRLRQAHGVLVLDTCERVLRPLRPLVEQILRDCPGLSVVATSRQPLGVPTELAWPVPPLSLPDPDATSAAEVRRAAAVRLFTERAADMRPGFTLDDGNAAAIARVCLQLDGLPLALELAAAHAGVLDVSKMAGVLNDRLRLLVDGARLDRQHTLRSTIAWSYELLDGDEALFFERLAVFAGPFSLEAGVTVAGDGLRRDGLELLLALARQSLVTTDGDHYRLFDTIQAFAAERLGQRAGEAASTARRHAAWYAELAREADRHLRGRDTEAWLLEVRRALPNVRRAVEWAFAEGEGRLATRLVASMSWFWAVEGTFEEAARWLDAAMAIVPAGTRMQAHLLASAGMHACSLGDLQAAAPQLQAAADLLDSLGDPAGTAHALVYLGIAAWGTGDDERAAACHDRAVALSAEAGDVWAESLSVVLRARTALSRREGDVAARLDAAERAARRGGDPHVMAMALDQRARWECACACYEAALEHATESLRLNASFGYQEGVVASRNAVGLALLGSGREAEARRAFREALAEAVALHHPGSIAEGLDLTAVVAAREGDHRKAARMLGAAGELRARCGLRRSALVDQLVAKVEATLSEAFDEAALTQLRRAGAGLDVHEMVAAAG